MKLKDTHTEILVNDQLSSKGGVRINFTFVLRSRFNRAAKPTMAETERLSPGTGKVTGGRVFQLKSTRDADSQLKVVY